MGVNSLEVIECSQVYKHTIGKETLLYGILDVV